MTVINTLTVDVEDHFQVHAFSDVINRGDWDSFEPRVERNTYRLLDILDSVEVQRSEVRGQRSEIRSRKSEVGNQKTEDRRQKTASGIQKTTNMNETESDPDSPNSLLPAEPYGNRATFFILGWVAERYPTLVKEIYARGHEVACHGYAHQCVHNQTPDHFREDVLKAKGILEDLIGAEVIGYRAPSFSITGETLWALKILFELGFYYDSSIFPIKHDFYGFPEAPRFPFYIDFSDGYVLSQLQNPQYLHEIEHSADSPTPCALRRPPASGLVEFPISTIALFGLNLPCSGGGYFRLFPYWYTRRGFKQLNDNGAKPAVFYIHPWELDPEIPRITQTSHLSKFRTYVNLKNTEVKFRRLLSEFTFVPLASMLKDARPSLSSK